MNRYVLQRISVPLLLTGVFHGKRVSEELMIRVVACLAEGLGIRGTARVCEIDPSTVLRWLGEAAEQLRAFSQYFLRELPLTQVQLDELYAVLSAVKDGEVSEDEAIGRLARSPRWVWTAMDPQSKLLLILDIGERTLAMAQQVVHQVAQVLAPGCVPLFLTDGYKEYATALLSHFGYWVRPWAPADEATLDAAARAAVCPGDQDHETATPRGGETPSCLRYESGR